MATYFVKATVELEVEASDGTIDDILYYHTMENLGEVQEALDELLEGMQDSEYDLKISASLGK